MAKIAIFGAGALGREFYVLINQINQVKKQWNFIGFFDDDPQKKDLYFNIPVLGALEDINDWNEPLNLVLAIADTGIKERIAGKISNPLIIFPRLIHPSVQTEDFQKICIGEGSVLCAGTILTHNINIGRHVLVNLSCTIGHDCIIEDFSSIMPGVHISGKVLIEQGVYVGSGAVVIHQKSIGAGSIIGAGAVITKNMEPGIVAAGVPATIIRYLDS
jgi:sugar O-acyltransferase (sialic acid O-acetyltransferase NeuD family)